MGKYIYTSLVTRINVKRGYQDEFVRVDKSRFLQEQGIDGYGLYANKTYVKGEPILEYRGKIITDADCEKKKRYTQYMFDVKEKGRVIHVIDGANSKYASAAKFTNTTATFKDTKRNSEFKQYKKRIYLVASKTIRNKKEIVSYYGQDTTKMLFSK
jgi:hypothetical protein